MKFSPKTEKSETSIVLPGVLQGPSPQAGPELPAEIRCNLGAVCRVQLGGVRLNALSGGVLATSATHAIWT